jgi:hypothetical protein
MANPFFIGRHRMGCCALMCALLLAGASALAAGEVNTIDSIKTAKGGSEIEITITSTRPFLQSDLPVLRIGNQEFTISRYSDSFSPHTLIFTLPADAFARARTGEKVTFQYGRGEGRNELDFGVLNKSRRDK